MNILFDLVASQPESNLKYHGGSEYAKAVFLAIAPKSRDRLFCIYDSRRNLDPYISNYCQDNDIPLIDISNLGNLNHVIKKFNISIFFSALPLEKLIQKTLPFNNHVKSIITIHGLRSLELPSDRFELKYRKRIYHILKFLLKKIIPVYYKKVLNLKIKKLISNYNNPTIITVSNYSRLSLKYFFPEIPDENIHMLYSPIIDYSQKVKDESILIMNRLDLKKYFLLLSAAIWQKNGYRILLAFNSLIKRNLLKEYKLVIVGAPKAFKQNFKHKSFVYLDYVERMDLEILLKDAHALIYPSLNEGFGYPPLEAFKYGTGVIASAIGPIMEVCGDAALFFNPYSILEIKLKIIQSLSDPSFHTNTQQRIDRYFHIKQKQINDLETLTNLICD